MNEVQVAKALEVHERAVGYFKISERFGYKFIMELKKIRDERLYKHLGYSNFDEYCKSAWGVKRRVIDEKIQMASSLPEDYFERYSAKFGHKKTLLLSMMDEEHRERVINEGIPTEQGIKSIDEATQQELNEYRRRLKQMEQEKLMAEKRLSETIDQSNQRIRELEGQLEQAKAEVRVKEVVKEVIPPELIEKVNSLEQQLKQEREKRRELQTQLEEKEEDLIALTRSQLLEKDRYKIHDLLSEMNSQVGKFIKKVEMEINKLKGDREVTESVLASVKTLRSSADQLEKLIEVKEEKGGIVDAEYTVIT